jgi:hypothetical protein
MALCDFVNAFIQIRIKKYRSVDAFTKSQGKHTTNNKMSGALTRGRTTITRKHDQGGHIVHEAVEFENFLHLTVLRGSSIDDDDFVNVEQNAQNNVELRLMVGENAEAMHFTIGPELRATQIVTNLHVQPYEQVVVSASCKNSRCIISGFFTRKAVTR